MIFVRIIYKLTGILHTYSCIYLLDQLSPKILNFNIKIYISKNQTSQSKLVVLYTGHIKNHLKSFKKNTVAEVIGMGWSLGVFYLIWF